MTRYMLCSPDGNFVIFDVLCTTCISSDGNAFDIYYSAFGKDECISKASGRLRWASLVKSGWHYYATVLI